MDKTRRRRTIRARKAGRVAVKMKYPPRNKTTASEREREREKKQTGESILWGLWVVNQDVGWVRTCGTLMFDCSWSHQNSCYSGIMDSITSSNTNDPKH